MKVKTTYLQMFARPERAVPPVEGVTVVHAKRPTVAYYRFLYDAVGRDYDWTSRKKLSDAELARIIHDPLDEVHVLHVPGLRPARRGGGTSASRGHPQADGPNSPSADA